MFNQISHHPLNGVFLKVVENEVQCENNSLLGYLSHLIPKINALRSPILALALSVCLPWESKPDPQMSVLSQTTRQATSTFVVLPEPLSSRSFDSVFQEQRLRRKHHLHRVLMSLIYTRPAVRIMMLWTPGSPETQKARRWFLIVKKHAVNFHRKLTISFTF